MALKLDDKLVVGISSRALFDLEEEDKIYKSKGLKAFIEYERLHENDILKPGTAFPLIKALHKLNSSGKYLVEIIIMSKNSADTSLRIFNSITGWISAVRPWSVGDRLHLISMLLKQICFYRRMRRMYRKLLMPILLPELFVHIRIFRLIRIRILSRSVLLLTEMRSFFQMNQRKYFNLRDWMLFRSMSI